MSPRQEKDCLRQKDYSNRENLSGNPPFLIQNTYSKYQSNAFISVLRTILWRFSNLFRDEGLVVSSLITSLGVSNVVLSLFPFLKRLGTTLPQIFFAAQVRNKQIKKWLFTVSAFAFGGLWLLLGLLLVQYGAYLTPRRILALIAIIYFSSMVILAACNLTNQILRAKLLPPDRRGRLQAAALFIWAPISVVLSYSVIRPMLSGGEVSLLEYGKLFVVAGTAFAVVGIINALYNEKPDPPDKRRSSIFAESLQAFRSQADFRRIIIIRAGIFLIFGSIPFFTAYGRQVAEAAGVKWETLIGISLIALEVGKVLGTAAVGVIADRLGNRLPLVFTLFIGMFWSLSALTLGLLVNHGLLAAKVYFLVFLVQGLFHPAMFISTNYILEAAEDRHRPIYIAGGNLMRITPMLLTPLLGVTADLFNLEVVFIILTLVSGGLALLALRMKEPRDKLIRPEPIITLE